MSNLRACPCCAQIWDSAQSGVCNTIWPWGSQAAFRETARFGRLSSQHLKGSSPTSSELVYKSDLKSPQRAFTKPLITLCETWNGVTKPRAQMLQGHKTEAGWHKRKFLVQKAFKDCSNFLHLFLSLTLQTPMPQPPAATLYFKYCLNKYLNKYLFQKEKQLHSHHTKHCLPATSTKVLSGLTPFISFSPHIL